MTRQLQQQSHVSIRWRSPDALAYVKMYKDSGRMALLSAGYLSVGVSFIKLLRCGV